MRAATYNNQCYKYLIEYEIDIQDCNGHKASWYAAQSRHVDLAKELTELEGGVWDPSIVPIG